jgi:hypothetical protein
MKKFNKFGAAHKNIIKFDVEKIDNVDPNAAVFRIYSDKEDFFLFILPNYETKQIEVGTDVNTKFSDMVFEFLVNSGDIENVIKEVYKKAFQEVTVEEPKLMPLNLPSLELPKLMPLNLPSLELPKFTLPTYF